MKKIFSEWHRALTGDPSGIAPSKEVDQWTSAGVTTDGKGGGRNMFPQNSSNGLRFAAAKPRNIRPVASVVGHISSSDGVREWEYTTEEIFDEEDHITQQDLQQKEPVTLSESERNTDILIESEVRTDIGIKP